MKSVLAVLSIIGLTGCGVNFSHGEGDKIGQIVKFSRQGFVVDTWEGQLIRGGLTNGSGGFGVTPFDFTVEDERLVEAVHKALENQTEVIIHYRVEGVFFSLFRTESWGRFLVSIKPSVNQGAKP